VRWSKKKKKSKKSQLQQKGQMQKKNAFLSKRKNDKVKRMTSKGASTENGLDTSLRGKSRGFSPGDERGAAGVIRGDPTAAGRRRKPRTRFKRRSVVSGGERRPLFGTETNEKSWAKGQ